MYIYIYISGPKNGWTSSQTLFTLDLFSTIIHSSMFSFFARN